MTTKVHLSGELPENPVILEGFPSKGFVSTIATKHMIDSLEMEKIGYVDSDKVSNIAVVHEGEPMHPIRIYKKNDIVLIFSEVSIPSPHVREFADSLHEWFKEIDPKRVVLLAGLSGRETEKEHEIFGLTTDPQLREKMKGMDVEVMEEGMLAGISSDMMLNCIEDGMPVISFMAETEYTPDPLGAASLLRILSEFLDIEIDVEKLVEKGQDIEEEFKKITSEMQKGKQAHKEMDGYSPMYQ